MEAQRSYDAFIRAAVVPRDHDHGSGVLDEAASILAANPGLATADIHTAAILGDDATVRRFVESDPSSATAKGGPHGWDALTHLCFSRYLARDPSRSAGFVRAAAALLDAGANPNTGWFETSHQPMPAWESAIYGAAGIARDPDLTRLLLERGADPNDEETPYHAPEGWDNRALQVLVESGKLTDESLGTILVRKADWHDAEGIRWLLEHGVKAESISTFGNAALQHSIRRDNALEIIELLLDHGADPTRAHHGVTPIAMAARGGRSDVLEALDRRGIPTRLEGVDRLIEACARRNLDDVRTIIEREPELHRQLLQQGGALLAAFTGTGNPGGARILLDLGVDVDALFAEGDGYYGIAPNSTALHVAAWRMSHASVRLLIERGAAVDAVDGMGRTPLQLAVKACVDSYWTEYRTPESVQLLLEAGARLDDVRYPSGYAEVDRLLAAHGAV